MGFEVLDDEGDLSEGTEESFAQSDKYSFDDISGDESLLIAEELLPADQNRT